MFCTTAVKSIDDYQMQGNALNKRWLEERAGVPEEWLMPSCQHAWALCSESCASSHGNQCFISRVGRDEWTQAITAMSSTITSMKKCHWLHQQPGAGQINLVLLQGGESILLNAR